MTHRDIKTYPAHMVTYLTVITSWEMLVPEYLVAEFQITRRVIGLAGGTEYSALLGGI